MVKSASYELWIVNSETSVKIFIKISQKLTEQTKYQKSRKYALCLKRMEDMGRSTVRHFWEKICRLVLSMRNQRLFLIKLLLHLFPHISTLVNKNHRNSEPMNKIDWISFDLVRFLSQTVKHRPFLRNNLWDTCAPTPFASAPQLSQF